MRSIIKKNACLVLILAITGICYGQKKASPDTRLVNTADSLASGNYKDILTSFFQLAFDNLTGQKKEFNFSSNPYAVMLRNNPKMAEEDNYTKYKALRKLNFNFGITLDTNYHFSGFSSGINYAIINKRDPTDSKLISKQLQIDSLGNERHTLILGLASYGDSLYPDAWTPEAPNFKRDSAALYKFNESLGDNINRLFDSAIAFKNLDADFKTVVLKFSKEKDLPILNKILTTYPDTSLFKLNRARWKALVKSIEKAPLWTIGISDTTNKNKFFFSNVVLVSEFSKGIFSPQPGANNLELNLKGQLNLLRDTLNPAEKNLKRAIFSFESGINWVIRNKANDRSYFELKFSGSYNHNFSRLYPKEERDVTTANATLRIRVIDDIWIPLEIKYDPKSGNVFGLLNVKFNFKALGTVAKNL